MKTSAFVITLERSVERRPHADWIVSQLPLPSEILNAVDGRALPQDLVAEVCQRQIHSPKYPHELSRGEIGCFLSHRNAWQTILDRNLDAALILEDDITFDRDELCSAVKFVELSAEPGDYVQFQVRDVVAFAPEVRDCGHALIQPRPAMLRTTAQFVTREAAQRLLDVTQSFDRPVDTFLQMTWITGVPVKVVTPCVVREISQQLGGSTLGGSRRPWHERLRRELLRPVYRAQIRYRSLKAS
ncbi:MAG: glycosyltransferase family 25 protein [Planctomycetaceae bacterium]